MSQTRTNEIGRIATVQEAMVEAGDERQSWGALRHGMTNRLRRTKMGCKIEHFVSSLIGQRNKDNKATANRSQNAGVWAGRLGEPYGWCN